MALPQSDESESLEPVPPGVSSAGETARPARPDWLTDAESASRDEMARAESGEPGPAMPRLVPKSAEPRAGETTAAPAGKGPAPWAAAASSIPTLRRRQASRPAAATTVRPAATRDPAAPDPDEAEPEFPDDGPAGAASNGPQKLVALDEPWPVLVADALRHNWKVQAAVGAALVLLLAFTFWPRSSPSVSLTEIHRHASQYDGRAVTVHGRVGEVFRMGGGYTFYLEQGHESIVVFSLARVPVPREKVTVSGTISTGYLDGVPRQTLFEPSH